MKLLQGEQGQPARPPACRCCSSSRSSSRSSTCLQRGDEFAEAGRSPSPAQRELSSSSPTSTEPATGVVLVVLIVLYIATQLGVEPRVDRRRPTRRSSGSSCALPFVFVAVHHQLPGRPDRLLDHDQLLDHRPAARGPEALPEARAAPVGRRRAEAGARQAGVGAPRRRAKARAPPARRQGRSGRDGRQRRTRQRPPDRRARRRSARAAALARRRDRACGAASRRRGAGRRRSARRSGRR